MEPVNIGRAAAASGASGASAKMTRHYEQVGLFSGPNRTDAGYRQYTEGQVHTLRFIRQARDLGFSIAQIGELVGLWQNRRRPSRRVKELAQAHIRELERKAQELLAMKATLEHLVQSCHGNDRPECPILDTLAAQKAAAPSGQRASPARTRVAARPGPRASRRQATGRR